MIILGLIILVVGVPTSIYIWYLSYRYPQDTITLPLPGGAEYEYSYVSTSDGGVIRSEFINLPSGESIGRDSQPTRFKILFKELGVIKTINKYNIENNRRNSRAVHKLQQKQQAEKDLILLFRRENHDSN